ncbi:MAG: hypothetical protein ACI4MH_01170 [Candidatus Coproplasma sp.]
MKKSKKVIILLLVAMVMLLSAFAFMGFTTNVAAWLTTIEQAKLLNKVQVGKTLRVLATFGTIKA